MSPSTLVTDRVTELLELELEEDRNYQRASALSWVAPGTATLPRAHKLVKVTVQDLATRGWMQCEYSVLIDVSQIAADLPEGIQTPWLVSVGTTFEQTQATLYATTPFDVSDTEPTTAGIIDPESADDDADRHVIASLDAAFGPKSAPTTVGDLIRQALTAHNGYRLDARIWRTCCFLLTAAGHRDVAMQVIDRVRTSTLSGIDSPDRIDAFATWLRDTEIPADLHWTCTDEGVPERWPSTPPAGTIVPSRALWREPGYEIPAEAPVEEQPLEDSFAGFSLDIWLQGMSILDLEFDTIDVRGTYGGTFQHQNLPIVERHLLDTFPTWAHATVGANRDLLDRYQRYVGELVRTNTGGQWIEAHTPEGSLDPVVQLAGNSRFVPTDFLRTVLTERTGHHFLNLYATASAPADATVRSATGAIAEVARHITANGIDYDTTGLAAEPFSAGWAVFKPFTPDPNDPLSFLDAPVGQAVFYIGHDARIEKYTSSLSPTECEQRFLQSSDGSTEP